MNILTDGSMRCASNRIIQINLSIPKASYFHLNLSDITIGLKAIYLILNWL